MLQIEQSDKDDLHHACSLGCPTTWQHQVLKWQLDTKKMQLWLFFRETEACVVIHQPTRDLVNNTGVALSRFDSSLQGLLCPAAAGTLVAVSKLNVRCPFLPPRGL